MKICPVASTRRAPVIIETNAVHHNDNAIFAVQAYAVRRLKPQCLQDGRKGISITVQDMLHIAVCIREIG